MSITFARKDILSKYKILGAGKIEELNILCLISAQHSWVKLAKMLLSMDSDNFQGKNCSFFVAVSKE